jgi:hypothetical protein
MVGDEELVESFERVSELLAFVTLSSGDPSA